MRSARMNKNDNKVVGTKLMVLAAFLFLVMHMSGCSRYNHPPLDLAFLPDPGDFIAANGTLLSLDEIAVLTADADYILIGEGHHNVCDHEIQLNLLNSFSTQHLVSIGFEMIGKDYQPVLDRFNNNELQPADLKTELEWEDKWGFPFDLFAPLFELAHKRNIPVFALNIQRGLSNKALTNGTESLDDIEQNFFPTEIIPPSEKQENVLSEIFGMHDFTDMTRSLERFFRAQSIWDSMMAEQAVHVQQSTGLPVVVITGTGHVEYGWGIAHRLDILDPGAKIVGLTPWRSGEFDPKEAPVRFYCPESFSGKMGMTIQTRHQGLTVTEVKRDSRAHKAGLRPGDIIIAVQGEPADSLMDLHTGGSRAHDMNRDLIFSISRKGLNLDVNLGPLGTMKTKDDK